VLAADRAGERDFLVAGQFGADALEVGGGDA
jgi:hypothetical protein